MYACVFHYYEKSSQVYVLYCIVYKLLNAYSSPYAYFSCRGYRRDNPGEVKSIEEHPLEANKVGKFLSVCSLVIFCRS